MRHGRLIARLGVRLFALCRLAFPAPFRRRYGVDLAEAFEAEMTARLRCGLVPAVAYVLRACVDALRQGGKERMLAGRSPAGHGARHAHGERLGRGSMWHGLWMDVRLGFRRLRGSPGFTAAATLVLALGIGANAAVFSALRTVVLAPPPFPEADRLVIADLTRQLSPDAPPQPMIWSFPKFLALLDTEGRLIEPIAGYANNGATLTEAGPPEVINIELVTPGYFDLVGRAPVLGRAFTADELRADPVPSVAVLSHELWRTRLGGDPDVLGRDIILNGHGLRVVGIAPAGFDGLTGGARAWIPMAAAGAVFSPFMIEGPGAHWFHALGRLAPGATLEEARAQMRSIGDGIAETYPSPNTARVYSGSARALASVRSNASARASVLLLTAAAALVLLVACANLSGLLLARARRASRDGAVRLAVGASRWRIVRASLVESVLLAALGGGAGVAVALGGTALMASSWPARFLSGQDGALRVMDPTAITVDGPVLAFALAVTAVAALGFGLAPALRDSRADLTEQLKDGTGATRRERRVLGIDARGALVGAQVGLAMMLVVGAGLVGGSVLRLLEVEEGFRTEKLVSFSYTIPTTSSRIDDPLALHVELVTGIERLPGVESATFGCAPLRGHCIITRVDAIQGAAPIRPGEGLEIGARMVDDGHFDKLGIPVIRGRAFDARDGTDASPSVVISELAANTLFPGEDPIGRFIELGMGSEGKDAASEVIGVVGDVLYEAPDEGLMAEAYYSYREFPENHGTVTVRTVGEPLDVVPAIRDVLEALEPTLALYRVETMDEVIVRSVGDRRTTLGLLALFAIVTVLLAATGTWGIVSYSVEDRRREIGLRLALGAGERRVMRGVLSQGLRTAVLGVGVGVVGGLLAARSIESLLWQTEPTDPLVFASGAALLVGVVLVASWLPARRATRLDPVLALRSE